MLAGTKTFRPYKQKIWNTVATVKHAAWSTPALTKAFDLNWEKGTALRRGRNKETVREEIRNTNQTQKNGGIVRGLTYYTNTNINVRKHDKHKGNC